MSKKTASVSDVLGNGNVNNVNNNNLNNVNNVRKNKPHAYQYSIAEVRNIASKLVDKLNDPGSIDFFLKVAWNLPEPTIWQNLEQAMTGRNPAAYFTFLCKMSMKP